MPGTDSADLLAKLLEQRRLFKSFLAARVGNDADAEDLLQTGLVRALQRADEIKHNEKIVPWFYQVLRNAIIDHARSRNAAAKRDEAWVTDSATLSDDPEADRQLCQCFEKLLPTLKSAQAELLRRVELRGEPVAYAAAALGMNPNQASVTLHRARRELRVKLMDFCGDCSCLENCECD